MKHLFLCLLSVTFSLYGWQKLKPKNGIEVYINDKAGSEIKQFKAGANFNINIHQFIPIIQSMYESCQPWMKQCLERKAIHQFSINHKIYYTYFSLPFPFENRDMILEYKLTENKKENSVYISLSGRPDFIPHRKEVTRVQVINGFWKIIQISDNQIYALYQMHMEPGGSIPAWMMNNFIEEKAFEMFEILKTITESKKS